MKYYIRLNADNNLVSEAVHAVSVDGDTVEIRDRVSFPMPKERVYATMFELVGEDGVVYAMRVLPPDYPKEHRPFMDRDIQLSFDWRLRVTSEGQRHLVTKEEADAKEAGTVRPPEVPQRGDARSTDAPTPSE